MNAAFREYVALGDSMSIDLYPALDAGRTDVAVALERVETAGMTAPLGAASLFFRNDDEAHPDESGNDLSSMYPGITFRRLATDGATIGDVFGEQLALLGESDDPSIITLTIGSEDLFSAFSRTPTPALLEAIAADLIEAYDLLVAAIRTERPNALILLTTVTDPSDRTGKVKGILDDRPLNLTAMDAFNSHIRKLTSDSDALRLADANGAFLGHGATQPEEHRWYWRRSPLELNAIGANELRKLWLETLRDAVYG
ncbi:MAG TPA: SGNH/GDSL hydrolase family protein [Gemmatimonadaceae bacterium]|nr:SGNH/GDSL hydrolase family protein [Gemmatimonadaceae bacterium]